MIEWYRFTLKIDNVTAAKNAQELFTDLLIATGGTSGLALFKKTDDAAGENVFYAAIPKQMTGEKNFIDKKFPLTPCARPTGLELDHLVSGENDLEDYSGICKGF